MLPKLAVTDYIVPFLLALLLSVVCTMIVRRLARRWRIVDEPGDAPERKIHATPIPLLGGMAIFLSVAFTALLYATLTDQLMGGYLLPKHVVGILIGGLLLMIGGFLDDKYNLPAKRQIWWPIMATGVVVAAGIGIPYISSPFGGVWNLDSIKLHVLTLGGLPYYFTVLADLFAFIWLMGMMYTTKFLDGLDGLVSGITTIGAIVIFFLSLRPEVGQPETALLAAILAGAAAGFLIFNFHPARVFLGEGGSLFTGYMLGVLSIISGGKIATALLIMGIPILDVLWVVVRRTFIERRSPFTSADRKHLHFRLLDAGFSHRQAVLLLYGLSALFGGLALATTGRQKLIFMLLTAGLMIVLGIILARSGRRH